MMFSAKRLLPFCQAVAHRSPARLPGRSRPILIKDVIGVEQDEGDLSSKVKYQLKQHIDDFFDFISDILQLSHKDRRKAVGYRKFAFIQVKDIKLSVASPLAVLSSSQFAYALFQRDIFFNWRMQTLTFDCAWSMNNRLTNDAWLQIRDAESMRDGASIESTFECCDEQKADRSNHYWTVVMGNEWQRHGSDYCSHSEILKSTDENKIIQRMRTIDQVSCDDSHGHYQQCATL